MILGAEHLRIFHNCSYDKNVLKLILFEVMVIIRGFNISCMEAVKGTDKCLNASFGNY